jgi:HrpA-like RNA helicase
MLQLTAIGRDMATFPLEPALSRMLLASVLHKVCSYMYVCVHACVQVHTYAHTHPPHTHTPQFLHDMLTGVGMLPYTYAFTHKNTHTHTYIYTHTHPYTSQCRHDMLTVVGCCRIHT